jgi:hypothetical protein
VTFVFDKAGLLWDRVTSAGLVEGDQTGRGAMLKQDWDDFLGNPLLGPVGGVTTVTLGTGHSSLMNTLAVNGLPCAALWFATLYLLMRQTLSPQMTWKFRLVVYSSWLLVLVSGILNPTWHFPCVTATVFLYLVALVPEPVIQPQSDPMLLGTAWGPQPQSM